MPLIRNLWKTPSPQPPGRMEGYTAVVGGSDSVPIALHLEGFETTGPVGVDLVFLIDNSGSMGWNDPHKHRFAAIKSMSQAFAPGRSDLDRIAIILFGGDDAVLAAPDDPWKQWSELPALVDTLGDPEGQTPFEKGMQLATELLAAQNGFYKLVIMLSDGYPVPDDAGYPQTTIVKNQRVPEAHGSRVLYSTVYLRLPVLENPEPIDNALLMYIASETDYVTQDREGDPPRYYFRIEDTALMVQAFRELFVHISNRCVPQDVRLVERIHPRLLLDPMIPPVFAGTALDAGRNVLGTPLNQTLAQFAPTGRFEVRLNELKGEVTLRFAVKLDLATITPQEFQNGYVLLPVDQPYPESRVQWLEPLPEAGTASCEIGLPQAEIRFELGRRVIKSLQDDGSLVTVEVHNLDLNPVPWFELLEYPSGFFNPIDMEDDFGFKPLAMLYKNRILPWFVKLVPAAVLPPPGPQRTQLLNQARAAIRQAHAPFLRLAPQLDPLLCQVSAEEMAEYIVDKATYWRTRDVRGAYRLAESIPGKARRALRFRVQDASFTLLGSGVRLLMAPVDATKKTTADPQRSIYRASDQPMQEILPNPLRSQFAYPAKRPDLWLLTALRESAWERFAGLFRGIDPPGSGNPWLLLDSPDIDPYWQAYGSSVGAKVRIRNCGAAPAVGASLRVRTYFLPFTGNEFMPPYAVQPALVGSAEVSLPPIPTHPYEEAFPVEVHFGSLSVLTGSGPGSAPVPPELIQQVRKALAVTVVEIDPADGEVMLANNRAIEVVPISCT